MEKPTIHTINNHPNQKETSTIMQRWQPPTETVSPSIFDLIQDCQWVKVTERLQKEPIEAFHFDDINRLPLHCAVNCSDMRTIRALLTANPKAIKSTENKDKRIPLHYFAAGDSSIDAMHELIEHFPKGLIVKDSQGCHPHTLARSDRAKNFLTQEFRRFKMEMNQKRVPDNDSCSSSSCSTLIKKRMRCSDDVSSKTESKTKCIRWSIPTDDMQPLGKLIERIENRESFLGITSTTKDVSLLERMNALDQLFWGEQQMGGMIERLHKLFFVDEGRSMSWSSWIETLEIEIGGKSFKSGECNDDIQVRIRRLESHIFGETQTGCLAKRLRALGDADI